MSNDGYIVRSYKEIWRESIKETAGADEVTRLPKCKIGAAEGVYVIYGHNHKDAAEYFLQQLKESSSLANQIVLADSIEEEFEVAIDIDYS